MTMMRDSERGCCHLVVKHAYTPTAFLFLLFWINQMDINIKKHHFSSLRGPELHLNEKNIQHQYVISFELHVTFMGDGTLICAVLRLESTDF